MSRSLREIQAAVALWALSDDVGLSSKDLARETCGIAVRNPYHPSDTSDFGRCYRLVLAVPEAREAVDRLGQNDVIWARLARVWDEATAAFKDEQTNGAINRWGARECPRTYAIIKAATR